MQITGAKIRTSLKLFKSQIFDLIYCSPNFNQADSLSKTVIRTTGLKTSGHIKIQRNCVRQPKGWFQSAPFKVCDSWHYSHSTEYCRSSRKRFSSQAAGRRINISHKKLVQLPCIVSGTAVQIRIQKSKRCISFHRASQGNRIHLTHYLLATWQHLRICVQYLKKKTTKKQRKPLLLCGRGDRIL